MASNKFNKKTAIQLTLVTIGVLLVFLIYFYSPIEKDEHQKTSEEISKVTGGIDLPPGFKLPF